MKSEMFKQCKDNLFFKIVSPCVFHGTLHIPVVSKCRISFIALYYIPYLERSVIRKDIRDALIV